MPVQATVYENYRDVDETTSRHRCAATTIECFDQQTPLTEIKQMWSKQKRALQYIFDVGEITELATGIKEYAFTTAVTEPGVTYILASSVLPAIACDLEQEIEVVVRMSPKAVRNTIVRITARNKGIPNPIL
jgi:RNA polymerase-interacting CarD/CdnL/TRCF family regulator